MPTTNTPNMNLALPVVSVEPGPTWASDLNAAFTLVDSHDHTTGKGLQVPTAGLNINADLSITSFNLTNARSSRYVNNGSPLALGTDLNCVYVSSGNLYYNNSAGVQVQITSGSSLNAASIGAIGGDYTTSTALEFYTSATKTFTFWQNTNVYANIEGGNLLIHEPATSTNAITIKSPTSLASAYNLTLPISNGSDGYVLRSTGSGVLMFHPIQGGSTINYGIAASVAASAMTIALKGADGTDASATNKVTFEFRNATSATGTPSYVSVTAALSTVISSGSTAGSVNAQPNWVYVYALNNAGTVELAWSGSNMWPEGTVQSTTAEGGAGAADSKTTLYSTTARSNVAIRLIGRIKSTQATAGTWASAPTEIALWPFEREKTRSEVWVDTGNGRGSSNTRFRRFTTTQRSIGTAITYADSATLGGSFTINEDGLYCIHYGDGSTGSPNMCIAYNPTNGTTDPQTLSAAQNLSHMIGSANRVSVASVSVALFAGDVLNACTEVDAGLISTNQCKFHITKVSW